jgi:excisionase family DNA binding protein
MKDDPLVVTVDEAAGLLGISRGLAYTLVHQGALPSIRLGRRLLVPRRRLQQLIDGNHCLRGDVPSRGDSQIFEEDGSHARTGAT